MYLWLKKSENVSTGLLLPVSYLVPRPHISQTYYLEIYISIPITYLPPPPNTEREREQERTKSFLIHPRLSSPPCDVTPNSNDTDITIQYNTYLPPPFSTPGDNDISDMISKTSRCGGRGDEMG